MGNNIRLVRLAALAAIGVISSISFSIGQVKEIVTLYSVSADTGADDHRASMADFVAWKMASTSFKDIAMYRTESCDVSAGDFQEKVQSYSVFGEFFEVVNVRPVIGRTLSQGEAFDDEKPAVVLSYELWKKAFDTDPAILGKTMSVDGARCLVVGVMPGSVNVPGQDRIWTIFSPRTFEGGGYDREFHVIARLQQGVTVDDAQKELTALDRKRHIKEPKYDSTWMARVELMKQL